MPFIADGVPVDTPQVPYQPVPLMPSDRKPMKPPKAVRIDQPLCWRCKQPVAGKVHWQGGSLNHPSHRKCLMRPA